MPRDYYETLGLARSASLQDIRRAYKKLARKYHPDLNPGDKAAEARFKEISEAYAVLGNAEKRREYDRFGRVASGKAGPDVHFEGFDFDPLGGFGRGGGLGDLFGDMFGRAGGRRTRREAGPQDGEDLTATARLRFEEAVRGAERELRIESRASCGRCGGYGRVSRSRESACPSCGGSGRAVVSHGHLSFSQTCVDCTGTGRVAGEACGECGAAGRVLRTETLRVKIPAGVDTGARVRVAGKGNGGLRGGRTGDLYVVVSVAEHPFFKRVGHHLECEAPLTVTEAALGAKIEVPTPYGVTRMKVPPGTQSGQVFRLREKGLPVLGGSRRGDLLVKTRIVVPRLRDERSKEILKELEELNPEDPREGLKRYF